MHYLCINPTYNGPLALLQAPAQALKAQCARVEGTFQDTNVPVGGKKPHTQYVLPMDSQLPNFPGLIN